ncbi:response regulator transcription factor [Micromonospora sp. KC721]|uniref:response regulator transcription factor n=1 Tax=Micromonospora sp. KC721 TaxID=2530380 RepID=UPI001A9DDE25|nr:response regulator transcription factor [Micromonospora sp. KC721]
MSTVDLGRVWCAPANEDTQVVPSLSVALVSHDGAQPPSLSPLHPRVTGDLSVVRPFDDVVVCYGHHPATDVRELHRTFGPRMPAVLVAARSFDQQDVITAFGHGATSYLVLTQTPEFCLRGAVITTANGESCLSPAAATTLLRHMQPVPAAPARIHSSTITPRERQIMELLATGHTVTEIAGHLRLTGKTVRNNLSNIYAKLQVRRQSEAILLWLGHQPQPEPIGAVRRHRS